METNWTMASPKSERVGGYRIVEDTDLRWRILRLNKRVAGPFSEKNEALKMAEAMSLRDACGL